MHSAGRDEDEDQTTPTSKDTKRKSVVGQMNKAFKFPPDAPSQQASGTATGDNDEDSEPAKAATASDKGKGRETPPKRPKESTSGIEVPPPPPVEKERADRASLSEDDDLGDDTVDIPL